MRQVAQGGLVDHPTGTTDRAVNTNPCVVDLDLVLGRPDPPGAVPNRLDEERAELEQAHYARYTPAPQPVELAV